MGCGYKGRRSPAIFSKTRGSIAVFLTIIVSALSFMIFFSADKLIREKDAEDRFMDIDIALRSILADYDSGIYDDYGLTVIGYSDANILKREFNRILFKNDFKDTEDAYVEFSSSLDDDDRLKEMIREHMENRIVSKIAGELVEKFDVLGSLTGFRELLETKSIIEAVIFDCEKISAGLASDFADIGAFDIKKAADLDSGYLVYKLDELRRFVKTLNDLLDSLEKLGLEKEKIAGDNDFFSDIINRIDIFSGSIGILKEALNKANGNISLLITVIELIGTDEDIPALLAGYLDIEISLEDLIPDISFEEGIKNLDLRAAKGGFFDELLLKVARNDLVIDENILDLLPYINEAEGILSRLGSFRDFFNDLSLEGIFESIYDQIVINEYIIDKFSYETNKTEGRYFLDEVEYILFGEGSQNENLRKVKFTLLLFRTALNYISIHIDSEKTALARSVGTAVSLLTFGIGGGIAAELVISSWALYEAYNDVARLLSGESIAVIKGKGDYSIDFGTGGGSKSPVKAGYDDYLRLFLAFSGANMKLGRIRNLICLNTGTDTSLLFTSVKGGFRNEFSIEKGY